MIFNDHSKLKGAHALLSPSQHSWVNYTDEKLIHRFSAWTAAARGTALHELAARLIQLGVPLPEEPVTTLALYVNDALGFRMRPEQTLFYSENCFGTADCIAFRNNKLRIADLKNGITPSHVRQLEVYAAIFCLEYKFKPHKIEIELRVYQHNECRIYDADPDAIAHIMDRIVTFDKMIKELREEADL